MKNSNSFQWTEKRHKLRKIVKTLTFTNTRFTSVNVLNQLNILIQRLQRSRITRGRRTFFSPHTWLSDCFPRRASDPSMTSSCTRLAVWIISVIMAMALCPGSRSLEADRPSGLGVWRLDVAVSRCLPGSVAVDVERSSHQHHDDRPDGLPSAVEVVVAQRLQLRPGNEELLGGSGLSVNGGICMNVLETNDPLTFLISSYNVVKSFCANEKGSFNLASLCVDRQQRG